MFHSTAVFPVIRRCETLTSVHGSLSRRAAETENAALFCCTSFRLQCGFVMASRRQSCATSQHFLPSRVALLFGRVLVLTVGVEPLCKVDSSTFQTIGLKVTTLWWKSFLILPESLFHNVSLMNMGCVFICDCLKCLYVEFRNTY